MTTLAHIKAAIGELSEEDRSTLVSWLASSDREAWDTQIARDFSPGGGGMELLKEVDEGIDRGDFIPLG